MGFLKRTRFWRQPDYRTHLILKWVSVFVLTIVFMAFANFGNVPIKVQVLASLLTAYVLVELYLYFESRSLMRIIGDSVLRVKRAEKYYSQISHPHFYFLLKKLTTSFIHWVIVDVKSNKFDKKEIEKLTYTLKSQIVKWLKNMDEVVEVGSRKKYLGFAYGLLRSIDTMGDELIEKVLSAHSTSKKRVYIAERFIQLLEMANSNFKEL